MKRNAEHNLNRIAAVIVALAGIAAVAMADDATLRDGVQVAGPTVALGDIAVLDGAYAESLAEIEIATFDERGGEMKLTRFDVRDRLTEAGVHWGKLSLRGHQRLTVARLTETVPDTVHAETVSDTVSAASPEGEAAANPVGDAAVGEPATAAANDQTLKQAITDWLLAATAAEPDDTRIVYHDELDDAWSLRQGRGRFEIEPRTVDPVGRVPFSVRRYVGEELAETESVRVDVLLRRPVLAVRRHVRRGQILTDADLKREDRWLESLDPAPAAADLDAAVGRQADRTMKPGYVVRVDDLTAPEMVKRGQLITVRAISGGLVIRTVARAGESGRLNQLIEARNPRTREVFHVRVTGSQEAVMVIDAPAAMNASGGES